MATIRERNGTYQITVYSGFDLNGRRKRETTTFTPPKELSPKKKEKVVQAFAMAVITPQYRCLISWRIPHGFPLVLGRA